MKAAVKAQKQNTLECKQLELGHKHNNSHNIFRTVRELEEKPKKQRRKHLHIQKRGQEMLRRTF